VTHGPTRRVRQLISARSVSLGELAAAEHEADLLAHPYIGVEHVELARLRLAGKHDQRAALLRRVSPGVRRRWWRPRGPRSALRQAGLAATEAARRRAELDEAREADR